MRVLIAPDSYGESLTATTAAEAIAGGWLAARPDDDVKMLAQSDGGPGFVAVLGDDGGDLRTTRVAGPLGEQVAADWLLRSTTAYVECAQACGLGLLGGSPTVQTAIAAQTRGVGQLIDAALVAGARRIVVGLGGSATTDGGRGMIDALGGLDVARRRLAHLDVVAASDVDNPLLGSAGAAQVFGPQKGADPPTVALLERRLELWARELDAAAGRAVSREPGAGAAGGLGAALLAVGGRRESGAAIVAASTRLADEVKTADLVISGEGRLDGQSLRGKVVSAVAALAGAGGVPMWVLAGQVTLDEQAWRSAGIGDVFSIAEHAGSVRLAIEDAANQLAGLARGAAEKYRNSGGSRYRC